MRGSEVEINLENMKAWTPSGRASDTMKISVCASGALGLGAELRKAMSEKMQDSCNMSIYATDDMKVLVLHPDAESDFRYPKSGRRMFRGYVNELKRKGYNIPAVYRVEWNEKAQSWVGILQEVAECPKLENRRRKNGK